MPSLLQRQLFREILHLFLLSVGVLLTLLLISRAVQMRELLLGLDIDLVDMVRLFAYMVPLFLLLTIPVACMLSTFLTFLRMGTDRELVALRAGGVSIYQMLPAPFLFAFLCMLLTFWVSLHLLSWGMGQFRTEVLDIAANRARIEIQPGVFNTDFPDLVLFARQVAPEEGTLFNVMVNDRSRPGRTLTILAPQGDIRADHAKGALVFVLADGNLYSVAADGSSVLSFKTYTVTLPLSSVFKGVNIGSERPQEMSMDTLRVQMLEYRDRASSLAASGEAKKAADARRFANRLELEQHKRLTYPVACLVLTLFVLPLGAVFQGLHRQIGLVLTLGMFFVYYSLMSLGTVLGEAGILPPSICLWIPNALFLAAGLWGLRMTAHERAPNLTDWLFALSRRRSALRQGGAA